MQVDTKYLRQHYASLSDKALLAIDRDELIEAARQCYDQELSSRQLQSRAIHDRDDETGIPAEMSTAEDEPEWMEEAVVLFASLVNPGRPITDHVGQVADAQSVLKAAGIPCYLHLYQFPDEPKDNTPESTHEWRLLVPSKLNLQATSVLEQQIFNLTFEADWKTHLEMLSDIELEEMHPRVVFGGLYDRIERANRAYEEELDRRGLGEKSA